MRHLRQCTNRRQIVAVYKADYRVLTHVSWQEAVRLLLRDSVCVIERHSPAVHIHGPSTVIELPVSVALGEYIHVLYRRGNRATRDGVLQRDSYTSTYCGAYRDTLDHVIPESRGGHNSSAPPDIPRSPNRHGSGLLSRRATLIPGSSPGRGATCAR